MNAPVDADTADPEADPAADAVMDLIFGRWRSQTLHAGVKLGIFEVLADGPLAAEDVAHLCDVAGGQGYLLSHLLREHPGLTGEVLELPAIAEEAGTVPENVGVADRIEFTAGDMFDAVPEAEGYLMKHILRDWDDEGCVQILKNIRAAGASGAPVFVAEHVVPGPDTPHFAKLLDLHMMVATGGRERTVEGYGELFNRAGLKLAGHHRAEDQPMSVVEGRVP